MKILVIPGFSKEAKSANTTCVEEIVQELNAMSGIEVVVTGTVLKKASPNINWKKHPLFMIKKIINWPVMDPIASDLCFKQICKELSKNKYDAMIVSHMPYDGVIAAIRAKRRYPNVILMLYELDPITYEIDKARKSLGRYLYFMRKRAEKITYNRSDVILHMECNRPHFSGEMYKKYNEKSLYLDFPLIHNRMLLDSPSKPYSNQKVRLVYAGKLMNHFRSPEFLLKVIVETRKLIDLEIFFFSNGDCEEIITNYSKKYPFIIQKGFVEKAILDEEIGKSDCLVNIGNKISDMLPSKILTYIETGMPILHISNQKGDACISYLKRYELAIILSENNAIEECASRLAVFLRDNYGRRLSSDVIVNRFEQNTGYYSACKIVEKINNSVHRSEI